MAMASSNTIFALFFFFFLLVSTCSNQWNYRTFWQPWGQINKTFLHVAMVLEFENSTKLHL